MTTILRYNKLITDIKLTYCRIGHLADEKQSLLENREKLNILKEELNIIELELNDINVESDKIRKGFIDVLNNFLNSFAAIRKQFPLEFLATEHGKNGVYLNLCNDLNVVLQSEAETICYSKLNVSNDNWDLASFEILLNETKMTLSNIKFYTKMQAIVIYKNIIERIGSLIKSEEVYY